MAKNIQISEGVQFYFGNDQQQAAIDQVIDLKKIPNDLSWDDVEKYNGAKLSAHSVQVEMWKLMNNIWENVWGEVIDKNNYKPVENIWYESEYSLEYVWKNYLYKAYRYNGNVISAYCSVTREEGVQIGFSVENESGDYEISNKLQLSEGWLTEEDEDNIRWIKQNVVPIAAQSQVSTDELSKLANEVMLKLEVAM